MIFKKHNSLIVLPALILVILIAMILSGKTANATEPKELKPGSKITATDYNKKTPTLYSTPFYSHYQLFKYKVSVPKAGTAAVRVFTYSGGGSVSLKGGMGSPVINKADGTYKVYYYRFNKKKTVTLTVTVAAPNSFNGNSVAFSVAHIPNNPMKLKNKKTYCHAGMIPKAGSASKFYLKAPSDGYFVLGANDVTSKKSDIYYKQKGFKGFWKLDYTNTAIPVAAKKGKTMLQIKAETPLYAIKSPFKKFKESSFGKTRAKAAAIKKKKTIKGLLIPGKKTPHWYKFNNRKKQRVRCRIYCGITYTAKRGGIKFTFYRGKNSTWAKAYKSTKDTIPLTSNDNNTLDKGTYHIKVVPYGDCSGFYKFTLK